jgi:phenylalanyl-tRNA synthetase alpha subunit
MKQTAMQELRNDLVKAKEKSITALNDINNEILRKTCQEAVKLTIESIIERIDDELLEMEKQQIIKHSVELAKILFSNPMQTSGKTAQELVDNYFKNTNK